jgi:hypothetical protein
MKQIQGVLSIFFSVLFSISPQILGADEPKSNGLIGLYSRSGKILVYPDFLPGPNGPVIKFVVFGAYEVPEILVRTPNALTQFPVTTVFFEKANRFSGWIDAPQEEIVSIWIDGWLIEWEDHRWQ